MKCRFCNKQTIGIRNTCSAECLRKSKSINGKLTINRNRPKGESHYLWIGGKQNRKNKISEYKQKYPERVSARQKVADSLRRGKLKKSPCSICGNSKSEAHHEDYNKPLEIIWLCRMHHREADMKLNIGSKDFKSLATR